MHQNPNWNSTVAYSPEPDCLWFPYPWVSSLKHSCSFSHTNIHSATVLTYRLFKLSRRRCGKLLLTRLWACSSNRLGKKQEKPLLNLRKEIMYFTKSLCCFTDCGREGSPSLLAGEILLKWVTDLFLPSVSVSLALLRSAHASLVMWCIQMVG